MLKLIRYGNIYGHEEIWYWVNEEDNVASPIFETEPEALSWAGKHNLIVQA